VTWVVGGGARFGYGVGMSDIRVSWDCGYKDCLQKIYPVGNFIIAGFAGSVWLGFYLINDLRNFLYHEDPNWAWFPEYVAIKWWRRARRIFSLADDKYKTHGSSILMIGVHPTKNEGDSPWAKVDVCSFRSPEFEPKFAPKYDFVSIGSGSNVDVYKDMLRKSSNDITMLQGEVNWRGGFGHSIKICLTESLREHREPSVSPHIHIFIVERDKFSIGNNNYKRTSQNGFIEFNMPRVATTWNEFETLCRIEGISSVTAKC